MVMLKFHERDDIFELSRVDDDVDTDIRVIIPGGFVEAGAYVRLTAPTFGVDNVIRVIRAERKIDRWGDLSTIEGKFVK